MFGGFFIVIGFTGFELGGWFEWGGLGIFLVGGVWFGLGGFIVLVLFLVLKGWFYLV